MDERKDQAAMIIHSAATVEAATAGVMAQLSWFGADVPILAAVNITMIISLGKLFGRELERTVVTTIVGQILAVTSGTILAKALIGWIPIFGNLANAGVAFGVTEAIGWAAYLAFVDGGELPTTGAEWKELLKQGKKIEKPDVKKMLDQMTPQDKVRYQSHLDKSKDNNLPDSEKEAVMLEMAQFSKAYKS